jgi:chromatin segregation and condensation protein Rec8/ScpA/Scc1 (kleisin family)
MAKKKSTGKKGNSKKKTDDSTSESTKKKNIKKEEPEIDSFEEEEPETDSIEEEQYKVKEIIEATNELIEKKQAIAGDKQPLPEKFWQKDEWRVLLDPTLVKSEEITQYDLSALITDFTNNMLIQDLVDFRISGMAIYSTAKLYHKKIRDVIEEEEQIQLRELRDQARREIPKAMPQPIREPLKIATREELFGAMRAAIIETMQKREILRRKRISREERRTEIQIIKSSNKLPLEILKHITGKDRTVEEVLNYWFEKIRRQIKLNGGKDTSYDEMCDEVISTETKDSYGKKIKSIEFFLSLLFLSTGGRILIDQESDFEDIIISIPRHIV